MLRKYCSILFMLSFAVILCGAEYKTIMGGKTKNVKEGWIYGNTYCQMGFLNPSKHIGSLAANDIDIITRQDVTGKFTLEERESKLRIFFKPELRVTTVARKPRTVRGDGEWNLEKIPGGVKYSRTHADATNNIDLVISAVPNKKSAQINFSVTVENSGNGTCKVDFSTAFNFLRNDVQPLDLTVRRAMVRYYNGKRSEFFYNENTLLDGSLRYYWWRRVSPDNKEFLSHFNRERIPFNHSRLKTPEIFGLTGLAGKGALIWDMGKTPLSKLDISWEGVLAGVQPIWNLVLKPGEKREMKFRLLTLRGIDQIDAVKGDWVFAYSLEDDLLNVQALPLVPQQGLRMQAALSDSRNNQVLVNDNALMAAMNPFVPGKIEWRAASKFISGVNYPIKVTVTRDRDRSVLVEASEVVVYE